MIFQIDRSECASISPDETGLPTDIRGRGMLTGMIQQFTDKGVHFPIWLF